MLRLALVAGRKLPEVAVDPGSASGGRGAWVHRSKRCFDACDERAFRRAFRVPAVIPAELVAHVEWRADDDNRCEPGRVSRALGHMKAGATT